MWAREIILECNLILKELLLLIVRHRMNYPRRHLNLHLILGRFSLSWRWARLQLLVQGLIAQRTRARNHIEILKKQRMVRRWRRWRNVRIVVVLIRIRRKLSMCTCTSTSDSETIKWFKFNLKIYFLKKIDIK